jgi:hypothetical protein
MNVQDLMETTQPIPYVFSQGDTPTSTSWFRIGSHDIASPPLLMITWSDLYRSVATPMTMPESHTEARREMLWELEEWVFNLTDGDPDPLLIWF